MIYLTDALGQQFGLYKTDTDPSDFTMIGQRFHTEDGHEVKLIENGAVALASGVLTQNVPTIANHNNIAVVTYTNTNVTTGTLATITATLGATKADANYYAGGLAIVNAGTGIGQTLSISSSTATAASGVITLTLALPAGVALDNTSKLCLVAREGTGVVISPTTRTATPAGVTIYPVTASVANTYDGTTGALVTTGTPVFAFVATKGLVSCLSDVTIAGVGLGIMPSVTTAGAITVMAATGNHIGTTQIAGVSAESRPVYINI